MPGFDRIDLAYDPIENAERVRLADGKMNGERRRWKLRVEPAFVQPPTWWATPAESIAIMSSVKAMLLFFFVP